MFLPTGLRNWVEGGTAFTKGDYILLFQQEWDPAKECLPTEIRVLVRSVKFSQLRGVPVGSVTFIDKQNERSITWQLAGAFGGNNLPLNCPALYWDWLHPLPAEVVESFWLSPRESQALTGAAVFDWVLPRVSSLRKFRVPI